MDQRTILVIAATGTVGAPVVRQLRDDGYQVRLLVRDPRRVAARRSISTKWLTDLPRCA